MQFLLPIYYSLRSVLLRGLANSIKLLRNEFRFEKKFGLQTAAIKRSGSKQFFHYQGAPYSVLLRVFAELDKEYRTYDFFDIGCGKGRALFVAEQCGFTKLKGIDLDPELISLAKQNHASYTARSADSKFEFHHINAVEYNYEDHPTVYFLFNPFSETVMFEVLKKITQLNQKNKIFIYLNPLYPAPFYAHDMKLVKTLKTRWYTEALIFGTSHK